MNTIRELIRLSNGEELDIKYPIELFDKDGNLLYYENSDGFWCKNQYKDGEQVYFVNSDGLWWKSVYKDGHEVYFEGSDGYWLKYEYKDGKEVYCEDSDGHRVDNREPVDMTIEDVCKLVGKNVRIVG